MAFADETRPVHDVRLPLHDRLQQLEVLGGIVLEVGVLNDNHVAGGVLKPRRSAAPLPWLTAW